jgi:hypothetical protein
MPEPIADGEQPAAIVARERRVVAIEIGDVGEGRRQAVLGRGAQTGPDGVLDLAQAPGEGELLGIIDVLLAKHQHGVAVHAGVDRCHLVLGERLAHVDALDLARKTRADLADGDGHWRILLSLPPQLLLVGGRPIRPQQCAGS